MFRGEMTTSCSSIRPGSSAAAGTLPLDPKGWLAMQGEHYPITEIGLANLCRQLIKRGESAGDPSQVTVKRLRHARINTRACTLLEIMYPVHEPKTWGYLARVFVDNEWQFPIRVEVYELPLDRSKRTAACGGIYVSRPETQQRLQRRRF